MRKQKILEKHQTIFSNKSLNSNKLMLKENNRLITEEKELATVMNNFFINITESLDLKKDDDSSLNSINSKNLNDIFIPMDRKLVKLL